VPWELNVARVAAPLVAATATIGIIRVALRALRQREWRIGRVTNHAIVCGLGEKGSVLARGLRATGQEVVAIDLADRPESLEACRKRGVLLLRGDATDPGVLIDAGVRRAESLVCVCGDDGVNAQIAVTARRLAAGRTSPLRVHVHVVNRELRELLAPVAARTTDTYDMSLINLFESGAKAMLEADPPFDAIDGDGSGAPHILVIGLGELGDTVAVRAARRWQALRGDRPPLRITFVDGEAHEKRRALTIRHPQLTDAWELNDVTMDIESVDFEQGRYLPAEQRATVSAIYVCIDDDPLAAVTALTLARTFERVPIKVRVARTDSGLGGLLSEHHAEGDYPNVYPFGLLEAACTPDRLLLGER
ncbi:MAG TPA: NAD(P)-binding protein, partial [Solirubrobacteraceae bacterium]|nr:NAD(P)-binding protein [Solirubrobacteraceae bacterium]